MNIETGKSVLRLIRGQKILYRISNLNFYSFHYIRARMVTLTLFTLLDALLTDVGLRVGLTELNPIVTQWGIHSWILFRVLFLFCLVALFVTGYYLCREYSSTGLRILGVILFLLNAFIGAVVFSSVISIYLQIHAYT